MDDQTSPTEYFCLLGREKVLYIAETCCGGLAAGIGLVLFHRYEEAD